MPLSKFLVNLKKNKPDEALLPSYSHNCSSGYAKSGYTGGGREIAVEDDVKKIAIKLAKVKEEEKPENSEQPENPENPENPEEMTEGNLKQVSCGGSGHYAANVIYLSRFL